MCPVIGSRHGCIDEMCYVDLCEVCLAKTKHEHPLVEYLVPTLQYSFEQLFKSVPHLLNPNSDEKIKTITVWENSVKIFVSSGFNDQSFNEYRSEMLLPAVPFHSVHLINTYFQFSYGKILSRRCIDDVSRKGVQALKTWTQGETLPPPTEDDSLWKDVTCHGCSVSCIIGQRYHSATCNNYDLCSVCEKKGHEHPLELVPQLIED
ncbi:unnamed protein product [Rotaria magnacalcarata]|uniref:ZZ-type domain-containing protein n=1 Tax=Rotaria magnacalcarata TaxID=392030 RepID=A0A8S2V9Q5_9BILA|nr:unnamed protein product [Rotaria magnacalcarata]CAF4376421.1 unnamed protein product [Rotaria magnacalcarata]